MKLFVKVNLKSNFDYSFDVDVVVVIIIVVVKIAKVSEQNFMLSLMLS